jgi:transcriptional regulator of NAD metabolism
VHAIRDAEKEIKEEFMKLMQSKQMEIMNKFGLGGSQNKIEMPVYGELDLINSMTIKTPEGNQNIGDRIQELNAKSIIQV